VVYIKLLIIYDNIVLNFINIVLQYAPISDWEYLFLENAKERVYNFLNLKIVKNKNVYTGEFKHGSETLNDLS